MKTGQMGQMRFLILVFKSTRPIRIAASISLVAILRSGHLKTSRACPIDVSGAHNLVVPPLALVTFGDPAGLPINERSRDNGRPARAGPRA